MTEALLQNKGLPWPVMWADIFNREAPLLIEIGFGGGQFLVDLAQKRPSANLVGVEISLPSIEKAQKKVKTAGLKNVRLLQGDARYLLQALCSPQTVAEVYVNFPDPWPKKNHHHRRLINPNFLCLLATRLQPGGLVEIATDHADYASIITQTLETATYFSSRLAASYVNQDPGRLRTKYEQIGLDEGRTCYYYKWIRNDTPAKNSFPVPKEFPMPHVVLTSPLNLDEIQQKYGRWSLAAEGCHLSFMELFRAKEGMALLIEGYLREGPISQRLGLMVRQREPKNYVISLHELGFPRPTAGVHLAIGHLANWLVGLHPEARILYHNLQMESLGLVLNHAA